MNTPTAALVAPLACVRASALARQEHQRRWLVESLWAEAAVGILAGHPKSSKSWLAFDLAVSVASGTDCLGRYKVGCPGPVLLYAAEDPEVMVRQRLEGLARWHHVDFDELPVHVITEVALRLDRPGERERLRRNVIELRPRLLILDPLVRVYGDIDENSAGEVSGFLSQLRALQREFEMAILLVHHAKKQARGGRHAGQALRGSGDLYAWVDSLLYLAKQGPQLELTVEHRSAAAPEPVALKLVNSSTEPTHLELTADSSPRDTGSLSSRLLSLLTRNELPQTTDELRSALGVRKARLIELLTQLEGSGRLCRSSSGWRLAPAQPQGKAAVGGGATDSLEPGSLPPSCPT